MGSPQLLGILMVLASAAGFATVAIFIKYAYAAGANTTTVLAFRFGVAFLLLFSYLHYRGISLRLAPRQILRLFLLGIVGYGLMSALFAASLQYLPASMSSMLLYTYPLLVTLISFALGDEQFRWKTGAALGISFLGLTLVLGVSFHNIHLFGVLLALASALVYSGYIVATNRVVAKIHPLVVTSYVCASAALAFLVTGASTGQLIGAIPISGWLAMLALSFFGTIVGVLGFMAGMSRIGAAQSSIISTIEPVITVLLATCFLNEEITFFQTIGGALVLTGIILVQWRNKEASLA